MFEMAAPILSPAKFEVLSVIRLLKGKCEGPAEIHKQIVVVCFNVMNWKNVTKFCCEWLGESSTTMMRCKKKS
jgi:hypothetical protein